MTTTKTIRVKSTPAAINALFRANVPSFVVEKLVGTTIQADESLNVEFDWVGQRTEWCLPAEAVEIVPTKE